jgi:Bacterial aa3 type cytochrome c oxidase subunit IV
VLSDSREPRCPTRAIRLNPQRYCAWRDAMDDHGQLEYATARGNDYLGHEQTYRMFVTMTKIAIAVIAVIVILMAIFLT